MRRWCCFSILLLAIVANAQHQRNPAKAVPDGNVCVKPSAVATARPKIRGGYTTLAVSNGGRWLAISSNEDDPVQLWDAHSSLPPNVWPNTSRGLPIQFTPDASKLLIQSTTSHQEDSKQLISVCAVPSGKVLRRFTFSQDFFASWCDNSRFRVVQERQLVEFDLKSGHRHIETMEQAPEVGEDSSSDPHYSFSRNGAFIIEGSHGTIRWWRARDGKLLGQIKDRLRAIGRTVISRDGRWIASEGDDPNFKPSSIGMSEAANMRQLNFYVWNARTRKLQNTFPGSFLGSANLLEFSSDGRTVFHTGYNLRRFNLLTGIDSATTPNGLPMALSPDGYWLGDLHQQGFKLSLQIWSAPAPKLKASLFLPDALPGE